MNVALLVGYDGTAFSGYQRQKKGERTVQGVLEEAAAKVFRTPVRVTASGRTDAGVHALGQVCGMEVPASIPAERIAYCLNAVLPPDVRVYQSAEAPQGFDCTRSAKRKTYCYRVYCAPCEIPLLERYAVHLPAPADPARMRAAGKLLVGEKDFKAFCASGSSAKTTVRRIEDVSVTVQTKDLYTMYAISVTGNGFLYNMVRILAGELCAVGMGKEEGALLRALETGERSLLAKTMPAKGLSLVRVEYGTPLFSDR